MKYAIITLFVIFMATFTYAGGSIEQVGYLKDKGKNRIFTLSFKSGVTEQEIRKHAENLPNTSRRMTAAYYYIEGSAIPADGVTLAGTVFKANNMVYETPGLSKWQYAFMLGFKGVPQFVNCIKDPKNDLCRQK
jgi:hypothetical protein